MRKTLIAIAAAAPLVAVAAYAFAAQPATTGDDLFAKANTQASASGAVEPLKANVKSIRLGDDMDSEHGERGEHGEMGEGLDD